MAEMWTREIGSVGEGEGGSKGGDRGSRDSRRGSRKRTGRCQTRVEGEDGQGATYSGSPRTGSMGSLDRDTHARATVVALRRGQGRRRARAAPVGRVLLEGPAWAGSLRRVDARRHRVRPMSSARCRRVQIPRRSIRTGAMSAAPDSSRCPGFGRTNFHGSRDCPILVFPGLGGNELLGGSVRVDAARGSSRTKLPNLVVFAEARVARFVASVLDTPGLFFPDSRCYFPRLLNIAKGRIRQESNLVAPSLILHGYSVRGKA